MFSSGACFSPRRHTSSSGVFIRKVLARTLSSPVSVLPARRVEVGRVDSWGTRAIGSRVIDGAGHNNLESLSPWHVSGAHLLSIIPSDSKLKAVWDDEVQQVRRRGLRMAGLMLSLCGGLFHSTARQKKRRCFPSPRAREFLPSGPAGLLRASSGQTSSWRDKGNRRYSVGITVARRGRIDTIMSPVGGFDRRARFLHRGVDADAVSSEI